MFDWFDAVPERYCCLLLPRVIWPMVAADSAIAISYFAIGGYLLWIGIHRSAYTASLQGWRLMLGLFLILCGLGHLIDVAKIWYPLCDTMWIERVITAAVSVFTWLWAWRNKQELTDFFGTRQ